MKFLLAALNAKYIHSNPAIYSLRAWCVRQQPELAGQIELAEYTINQAKAAILADIYSRKPDAVGFSCYIWNWDMIREISCELAKVMPELPIWLGGPEVSYDPEELLREMPWITGVMVGEGEETFRELVNYYCSRWENAALAAVSRHPSGPEQIPGIVYRAKTQQKHMAVAVTNTILTENARADSIVRTAPRPLTDISALPFFYSTEDMADFQDRIIYYESSRGCPYRCSYCLSSIDKTVRLRDLELVKRELQFFLDRKVPQVKFVDRTFNCSHEHAMEIWNYIREHDNGITNFHFEIAADILTEAELELLGTLRPGLVQLEIGVQSTNPETLREIRRHMDWNHLKQVTERLQSGNNIHIHLDLIAGLPLENLESFRNSFNDVYSCRPEQLQLGFLKVLKGSYMHEKASAYGLVYTDHPPYEVLFTDWISYEDVLLLKRVEEIVEQYYNSAQFVHTLPLLETCFETPFALYEALADYMEEQGLLIQSPSRLHRYQVLLDFAVKTDPARENWYRQLLTLDLYLRENMKSRPDFAPAAVQDAKQRARLTRFYQKEAEQPEILADYVREGFDSRQMERMTHVECFTLPVWDASAVQRIGAMRQADTAQEDGTARQADPALECSTGREPSAETFREKTDWVLFDYKQRNPLNKEARTILLNLE